MTTNPPLIDPDTLPAYTPQPRFECSNKGVYYIPVKTDKDGNVTDGDPLRLADAVDLIGTGMDLQGSYYRVIRYRDRISRQNKTALLAAAEIGTNACWQRLQGMGITVQAGRDDTEQQPVMYNGDTGKAAAYTSTGSLEQWQQQVCRYAAGNSRLCLAIGTALAAPLLALLHEPRACHHLLMRRYFRHQSATAALKILA
ncbi:DUF927 domain-containing protein [Conchiformibius steedae]|uniref:DUF927 domain-containing protein n=1 Tax=Conchiformibius steedae TaxID=153493 RepID=A0A3P1ZZW9_9NEIS|nr:DUF927 domain-containing protein [Conchiformibius steedae]RRD88375.1 DUF927 domain-containing protein [Conchiformibius steedae]